MLTDSGAMPLSLAEGEEAPQPRELWGPVVTKAPIRALLILLGISCAILLIGYLAGWPL